MWHVAPWAVVDVNENAKMTGGMLGVQTNNRDIKKGGIGKVTLYYHYVVNGTRGQTRRLINLGRLIKRAHTNNVGNGGIADIAAENEATRIAQNRVTCEPAMDGSESGVEELAQPQPQHCLNA